jgi:hypothetical protein
MTSLSRLGQIAGSILMTFKEKQKHEDILIHNPWCGQRHSEKIRYLGDRYDKGIPS